MCYIPQLVVLICNVTKGNGGVFLKIFVITDLGLCGLGLFTGPTLSTAGGWERLCKLTASMGYFVVHWHRCFELVYDSVCSMHSLSIVVYCLMPCFTIPGIGEMSK